MKTLVVKIGTSTLCRGGNVDGVFLRDLARQIFELRDEWRVVVVTSGAIRVGLDTIGRKRAVRLPEKQAAAAIGQSLLMREYRRAFESIESENIACEIAPEKLSPQNGAAENANANGANENGDIEYSIQNDSMPVAQLLLTRADLADRRRFINARHTFAQLFKWNVVPIVNENDTVSTEEIRFGDNDNLASMTALCCEAQLVILLSDIDGFYLPDRKTPEARIENITTEVEAAAGGAGSVGGTGGMRTKIEAARLATQAGIELVIAHGRAENIVTRVARGEVVGTRFSAQSNSRTRARSRKNWMVSRQKPQGVLHLNDRARASLLERGSSLLPVGIERVEGDFVAGDVVAFGDSRGEFGRGISNFSARDLRLIQGLHSSQIADRLRREAAREAIHRDNLILLAATSSTRSSVKV